MKLRAGPRADKNMSTVALDKEAVETEFACLGSARRENGKVAKGKWL